MSVKHGNEWSRLQGPLSPLHRVTVPAEFRDGAGIPMDADYFCFIYPIQARQQLLLSEKKILG